jgi:hypothetical protein
LVRRFGFLDRLVDVNVCRAIKEYEDMVSEAESQFMPGGGPNLETYNQMVIAHCIARKYTEACQFAGSLNMVTLFGLILYGMYLEG